MDATLFLDGQCRLMLIGKTGNGKSSTGNTILGKKVFDPKTGINSGTTQGRLDSVNMDGVKLQVLDTPGLHDTKERDTVIMRRITRSLLAIHPGPHAVLLCLSCADRFTSEEMQILDTLKDSFGEALMSHLVVVMVKRDVLDIHGEEFEDQLEQCRELKALMTAVNNRYVLFDNRPAISPEVRDQQVQALMVKVMEVVRQNGGSCFRHKMTAEMDTSLIKMKRAELKKHGLEDIIEEVEEPQKRANRRSLEEGLDGNKKKSLLLVHAQGAVTRNRQLFETSVQEFNSPTGRAGSADDRGREPGLLNRRGSISNPELSLDTEERDARATLGLSDDTAAPDLSREEIAAKFTMKGKKKPQVKPRPAPPPPQSPPPARQPRGLDADRSPQDEKPPKKPPRMKSPERPEDPGMQSVMEASKQLETEQQRQHPDDHSRQQRTPPPPLVYVIPDKPGMTREQMRTMVDDALRRKLARGEGLTEEQEEEVEVVARSVGQKIKESMRRFRVDTLNKCSVM